MSITEVHVRDYVNWEKYHGEGVGIISIGDEGCIYHMPSKENTLQICKSIIEKGCKFKLVTPKIADRHMDSLINTLSLMHENDMDYILVVNDLGLLYEAFKRNILPQEVFLGRSLTRSYQDAPWIDEYIENEVYQEDVLSNTLADNLKIEYYSKFGVTGIETSLHNNSFQDLKKIAGMGWKISCHISNYAVAFSRKCAYAIHNKLQVGSCSEGCKNKIEISMSQTTNDTTFKPCLNKNNRDFTDLFLLGNILYRKNDITVERILKTNTKIFSYIIDDYDFTVPEAEKIVAILH